MARPQSLRFSSCGLSSLHYFLLRIIAIPARKGEAHLLSCPGEMLLKILAANRRVVFAQGEFVSQLVNVLHGGVLLGLFCAFRHVYISLYSSDISSYICEKSEKLSTKDSAESGA